MTSLTHVTSAVSAVSAVSLNAIISRGIARHRHKSASDKILFESSENSEHEQPQTIDVSQISKHAS
jgi:hypothetical protein